MTGRRVVVGIADMKLGRAGDHLVTHALGSCLGIVVHDPQTRVGGMLHVMLPDSRINKEKAENAPWMFVDTGVPLLFDACRRAGGKKERMVVKVAGGAGRAGGTERDSFQIGKRNMLMLRKLLWKNGVLIRGQDVGGQGSRDLHYDVATGAVTVRSSGTERAL
jgi:chemotaxis protein CheD